MARDLCCWLGIDYIYSTATNETLGGSWVDPDGLHGCCERTLLDPLRWFANIFTKELLDRSSAISRLVEVFSLKGFWGTVYHAAAKCRSRVGELQLLSNGVSQSYGPQKSYSFLQI